MKRTLVVASLVLALGAVASQASAVTVGASAYGGYTMPVLQADTGGGAIYGVRAPVGVMSMLTLEPFYASSSLGDAEEELGGLTYTRSGFDMSAIGVNAILGTIGGAGMKFYPFAGFGSYKLERTGSEDLKETGWSFGLGLGFPAGAKMSVHLRGELDMIVDGDTSRKFGSGTLGLSYNLMSGQ